MMDMSCPTDAAIYLSCLEDCLENNVWFNITPHEANGGLDQGRPEMKHTKCIEMCHSLTQRQQQLDEVA